MSTSVQQRSTYLQSLGVSDGAFDPVVAIDNIQNDLTVGGDISGDDVLVRGNLTVNGNTLLKNTLTAVGINAQTLTTAGNTSVNGNLTVAQNTTINGNVTATAGTTSVGTLTAGSATVNSLGVIGNASVGGAATVTGNLTATTGTSTFGTLVGGASTLNSLTVTNNENVNGVLTVGTSGNVISANQGSLNVAKNGVSVMITPGFKQGVPDNNTVQYEMPGTGLHYFWDDVECSNNSKTVTSTVTGNATVGGTLSVTGSATTGALTASSAAITNNATVGGTLGVTGATTLAATTTGALTASSENITGNATVGGTLTVTGATTLATTTTGALSATSLTSTGGVVNLGTGTAYSFVDNANNGTTFKRFSAGASRTQGYVNDSGISVTGPGGAYRLFISPGLVGGVDTPFVCAYTMLGTSSSTHYFANNLEVANSLLVDQSLNVLANATVTGTSTVGSGGSVVIVDQGTASLTKNSTTAVVTPGVRKGVTTANTVQYDVNGVVGSHFFNDNVEVDGNLQGNGTLTVSGALQTNDAAKVLKTLTVGDTSLTGYLTITPQTRKNVPLVDFCQYDLPGTGTHFFWDNVEVDGTLTGPLGRFGPASVNSYLAVTADNTTAIIDTAATLNPISVRTGGAERVSIQRDSFKVSTGGSERLLIGLDSAKVSGSVDIFSNTAATLNFLSSSASFGRIEMYGAGLFNMRFTASTIGSANTNAFQWTLTNSANSNVRMTLTDTAFTINMANGIKNSGTFWGNPSDARLKTIMGSYTKGLETLERIRPVNYKFKGNTPGTKGDTDDHVGVIAQELREVAPECVKVYTDTLDGVSTELLKVDASDLVWMLVNSVKELSARVTQLESHNCTRCKRKRAV